MPRYRLKIPTMVVQQRDGKGDAVMLPAGAIVESPHELPVRSPSNPAQTIEVLWEGSWARMFLIDLLERGLHLGDD